MKHSLSLFKALTNYIMNSSLIWRRGKIVNIRFIIQSLKVFENLVVVSLFDESSLYFTFREYKPKYHEYCTKLFKWMHECQTDLRPLIKYLFDINITREKLQAQVKISETQTVHRKSKVDYIDIPEKIMVL